MESIYRPILKQAFRDIWKYKLLWFFGLFASFFGSSGAISLGMSNANQAGGVGAFLYDARALLLKFGVRGTSWGEILKSFDLRFFVILIAVLAFVAFFVWISVVSEGALALASREAPRRKEVPFHEALKRGLAKFWPILWLKALLVAVLFAAVAVIGLPLAIGFLKTQNVILENLLVLVFILIFIPLSIILSFVVRYAVLYMAADNKKFAEGLRLAWRLFRKNWIVSLEMGVVLFLVQAVALLALRLGLVVLALPFFMLAKLAGLLASETLFWYVLGLGAVLYVAVIYIYVAAMMAFMMRAWVMLFDRIQGGQVLSRVFRWAASLGAKKSLPDNESGGQEQKIT